MSAARFAVVIGALAMAAGAPRHEGDPMPVIEVRAKSPGDWLALFMSGDGGWVVADRRLAQSLAEHGVSVIGVDSRAYLQRKRTPEQTSADVARTLEAYQQRWGTTRVVLIGSSRGADLLPFVANRFPDDLRSRVKLIAMLGVARWASFEFHWSDVVFDTHRPTDLPVLPELERLRGTRMLCVYGADEKNSLCPSIDTSLVTPYSRGGGHRLKGAQSSDLATLILDTLTP